jgi:hypothetical protein
MKAEGQSTKDDVHKHSREAIFLVLLSAVPP